MLLRFGLLCGVVGLVTTSSASLVIYSGNDAGASSIDPRPLSNAAAANFDAAAAGLGPVNLVTFESAPVGPYSNLLVAPGVTMNGIDDFLGQQQILNAPFSPPEALFGYNTTAGGTHFASMLGGTLTISFATPIQAFGAYFSGVQTALGHTIQFNDGAAQTVNLVQGSAGGLQFLGFTDVGKSISSITLTLTFDDIAFDDMRYTAASSVPEPAMPVTVGLGLIGLLRRRNQRGIN